MDATDPLDVAGAHQLDRGADVLDVIGAFQVLQLNAVCRPPAGAGAVVAEGTVSPAIVSPPSAHRLVLVNGSMSAITAQLEHPAHRGINAVALERLLDRLRLDVV